MSINNIIMIFLVIVGLVAGFFVGDYRGRDARAALAQAQHTGTAMESALKDSVTKLQSELDATNKAHQEEIEKSRQEYQAKLGEWQKTKSQLDSTIQSLNKKISDSDNRLAVLQQKLKTVSPQDRAQLEQQIQQLQNERNQLARDMAGNTCLKTPVPKAVLDEINSEAVKE